MTKNDYELRYLDICRRRTEMLLDIARDAIITGLIILVICVACEVVHSATLPDENQARCESLGGKWSVNHQCYNAGEPTTIKKLKENLKGVKYHE